MRIIFAGTPEFAAKALEALIQSEHEVVMVLSQPDRPAGRGRKLKESAVKALAKQHHIPVYTPLSLRVEKGGEETAEVLAKMQEANADVLVVAAYGLIVPQFVLDIPSGVLPQKYPTLKAVNIHGSLLPQWRGAAPIARAIERGDKETGITLMQMDAGLDTGPMLMKRSVEITPEDTAGDLTETLSRLGAEMLIEYLRDPEAFPPLPQPEGATYASKLAKAEGKIDWTASADKIADKVRAFNPVPGCFCTCGDEVLKIWMAFAEPEKKTGEAPGTVIESSVKGILAACGGGSVLRITRLQRPGGKQLDVRDFIAGHAFSKGEVLK